MSDEEIMDMVFEKHMRFLSAQREAEKMGQSEFECPLCGGTAWWSRAKVNNHLHCGCWKCGFLVMQ